MNVSFPYEEKPSSIFRSIKRPVAQVNFWSFRYQRWIRYVLIVDTGADYTVLPYSASFDLGINIKKDCRKYRTSGIGGTEIIYFTKKMKMKVGTREAVIPLGFLGRDDIPPLLGRYQCLDIFHVLFADFTTTFITNKYGSVEYTH